MKILKKLCSAVVAISTTLAIFSMNVSATGYTGKGDPKAAINKPKLTIDKKIVKISEVNNQVTIDLKVSGAQLAYSTTGIHVYWDSRLELAINSIFNDPEINKGNAIQKLAAGYPKEDRSGSQKGMNGYFLTTAGSSQKNMGIDGTMWSFTFILSNDAKIGDVYPIDIVYKPGDCFTNYTNDDEGDNMQAYAFKKGIYSVDNPTFRASANDILKVPALSKINKTYDGYIAVSSDNLLLGDANCDGRVTIADSVAINQALANPAVYALSPQGKDNADCCDRGDGVNANDAKAISMIESGFITAKDFPIKSSQLKQ